MHKHDYIEPQVLEFKTPQELVHIEHTTTLLQYKYWLMMVRAYREQYEENGAPSDSEFTYLSMKRVAGYLGYIPKKSDVEKDLDAIRRQPITFNVLEKDGTPAKKGSGFISEWKVSSAKIGVVLPSTLRPFIEKLDSKSAIFNILSWNTFNSFQGKYEAILYKLCKDYIGVKRTPYFELEAFRGYMGIGKDEYSVFKQLNQWVVTTPIKKINASEFSEITIEASYRRESRKIVGLHFVIYPKSQISLPSPCQSTFEAARVSIPSRVQKELLLSSSSTDIKNAIVRANHYADSQEKAGNSVNLMAIYRKAVKEKWVPLDADAKTTSKSSTGSSATIPSNLDISFVDDQLKSDFEFEILDAKVRSLSNEERFEKIRDFISSTGAQTFNPELNRFMSGLEQSRFNGWLRTCMKEPFDPEMFSSWKASRRARNSTK